MTGKGTITVKRVWPVIVALMLTGCASTHRVVIMNMTERDVQFTGTFSYTIGDSPHRVFQLAPGKSEGWFFDRSELLPDSLDSDLKRITLSHPGGCTAVLDRTQIEEAVKKRSKWWFYITDEMMQCP